MAREPLPDPAWTSSTTMSCLACGYSLGGLADSGTCPECGTAYHPFQLVMAGVPRTSAGTPLWRRLTWAGVLVVGGILSQAWGVLLVNQLWEIVVGTLVALIATVVFLVRTSPRERRGAERFVFTTAGISRLPLGVGQADAAFSDAFVPWAGADALELKWISAVWRRMRIGRRQVHSHKMSVVFEAGVRCPAAEAARVERIITSLMKGVLPDEAEAARVVPSPGHPPVAD